MFNPLNTLPPPLPTVQLVIRRYRPSDQEAIFSLFSAGIREHINPSFTNALSSPLYLGLTLGGAAVGYLVGGSVLGALLAGGAWIGLIYYCCYVLYDGYVKERLRTDMRDIPGCYLSHPDNCFWVAEAEVNGRAEAMGMVAVMAKKDGAGGTYGELFRMIVSSSCRRTGLGSRMTQMVIDFCKERGFTRVVLETSSTQASAVALYRKIGFVHVLTHTETHAPHWLTKLTRVNIIRMEKVI